MNAASLLQFAPRRLLPVVQFGQRKRASVHEAIEAVGARLLFLPPYSPDFNSIEKAFSRLQTMVRKAGERTVSGFWSLIGKLVDLF